MKVIVVGAGIMGLSIARSLSDAGYNVSVFDQGPIPNPQASSNDQHRLIRYPYGAHEGYMRMVTDAYEAWQRLWEALQSSYYIETGTLLLSASNSGWAHDSQAALRSSDIEFETLSQHAVAARFPFLRTDDLELAAFLPSGGILRAGQILHTLKAYLQENGARFFEHITITDIDCQTNTIKVREAGSLAADMLVVTAGAWTPDICPGLKTRITPSRQCVVYLTPPESDLQVWRNMPMILEIDPSTGFYLVPPAGKTALKIGDHRFSLRGHPNDSRTAESQVTQKIVHEAGRRLPCLASYPIDRSMICYYSVAPEERFIAERYSDSWVLAGFSGHGFKFGPLVGERFAQLIAGELNEEEFTRWLAGFY